MSESFPAGATVPDLIRQREQLTGWIARLDEVGPQASSRVTERVRADYAERLRGVNEALAAHRGEIELDLARFRAALAEAEEVRARAGDELDEASLRHLIGELGEAAWDEARPALERRVADADDAVARARDEVRQLQQLAADIAGEGSVPPSPESAEAEVDAPLPLMEVPAELDAGEAPDFGEPAVLEDERLAEAHPSTFAAPAGEPQPSVPPSADAPSAPSADDTLSEPAEGAREAAEPASVDEWDPFGGEFSAQPRQGDAEEDLPWLEGIDEATRGWTPPAADEGLDFLREIEESTRPGGPEIPPPSADLGADDLAFLEELDRAIGSSPASPAGSRAPTPPSPAPRPGGGRAEPLLCKQCGAINEPHSWYCEICGSEL